MMRYRLQTRLLLASFAAILTLLILLWTVHTHHFRANTIATLERDSEGLARGLLSANAARLSDMLNGEGDRLWVDRGMLIGDLDLALEPHLRHGRLVSAILYDHRGEVLYNSDRHAEPYAEGETNPTLAAALAGQVASDLEQEVNSAGNTQYLLETYIPILEDGAEAPRGVFELYTDITEDLEAAQRATYQMFVMLAAGLLILTLILWLIGRRADRLLAQHQASRERAHEALQRAHTDLEQRAERRAIELHQAMVSLDQAEARAGALVNSAFDAIVMLDETGATRVWNQAAEQLFGHSEAEMLGQPFHDIAVPERYREDFYRGLERFCRDGSGHVVGNVLELQALHASGAEIPVELAVSSINIDGRWNAIGIVRDISERRNAIRMLEEGLDSQKTLTTILETALANRPLRSKLADILGQVLATPWLRLEPRGAIFLLSPDGEELEMAAEQKLSDEIRAQCAGVPLGKCLCGRAAATGELVFADHVGEAHETSYPGIKPHGHYCVPLKSGNDTVHGVLNVYLPAGSVRDTRVEVFLESVATILSGLVERHQEQRRLAMLSLVVEQSPVTIAVTDTTGNLEYVNQKFTELSGFSPQEALGQNPRILKSGKTPKAVYEELWRTIKAGEVWRGELLNRSKSGNLFWEAEVIFPIRDDEDEIAHFVAVKEDITARKQSEADLQLREKAIESSLTGISIVEADSDGCPVVYANARFAEISGLDPTRLRGMPLFDALQGIDDEGDQERLQSALRRGETEMRTVGCRRPEGSRYWAEITLTPVREPHGHVTHYLVTLSDVTREIDYQRELEDLATLDTLTGLPNRRLLNDRLDHALAHARRHRGTVAVMIHDIDTFREVNDAHGHAVGDQLISEVGTRLLHALRQEDTVAHPGADEFVSVLPGVDEGTTLDSVMNKLSAAIAHPFGVAGHSFSVTFSTGVAVFPEDGEDPEALLRHADLALRAAKKKGAGTYIRYQKEMGAARSSQLQMKADLEQAVERDELRLVYQPKVDLESGRLVGAEALLRWQHPKDGLVPPFRFIPLAEETGLILPIGDWIFTEVCRQIRAWAEAGLQPLPVAINLSARQFALPDLPARIDAALSAHALEPRLIELELTESLLMDSPERAARMLEELHDSGYKLSIDDFGTGYSSLSYLRRFPIDVVKIDRSFVTNITTETGDAAIALATLSMAHSLGCRVVAEGVETLEQLLFLRHHRCDQMQGYYVSPPVPPDAFAAFLTRDEVLDFTVLDPGTTQRSVLVVEDETDVAAALSRVLQKIGLEVICASSGEESLDLLARRRVDIVLSDQRMPGMSGTELLQRVKELYPETVRMIISGYGDLETVVKAFNTGAVHKFLTKPWDNDRLQETLVESMRLLKLAEQNRSLEEEVRALRSGLD